MKSSKFISTVVASLGLTLVVGCSSVKTQPGATFQKAPTKVGTEGNISPGLITYPDVEIFHEGSNKIVNIPFAQKAASREIAENLASESCGGKYKIVKEDRNDVKRCMREDTTLGIKNGTCLQYGEFDFNELYYECEEGIEPKEVASVPYVIEEE